ncbi:3-oxoacyl-[acyl-carrier-protein] reductase [Shouchella shacheensis]|uniref:3-oxoacyl-[acyl-carrier-protein] reductase n=1 Tax=Shouchella shacheensis TaxID=1649580 RepID=UPI00073FC3B1|nr:3-oxoacyl-[acyl-carrier-protein] reductase [Shouchella shacheensis]
MKLENKVALITGAARGIGAATAKTFAKEGATLILTDLQAELLSELEAELHACEVKTVVANVTSREDIQALFKETLESYGRIDAVINNAGITADATLAKMSEEQWDQVIDINLKGVFNVGQAAAAVMKEQNGGVILNAASVVGLYGNFGQTNYAASKGGVISMTKTWAKELGRYGIRVNAIAPGFIATPMTAKMPAKVLEMMKEQSPLGVMGRPEDVANAYAFLASDEAAFITGTVLSVDGGAVI